MAISFEAIYENGVLRPERPLPLGEHQKVRVTVESEASPIVDAYGVVGWKGDHAALERFALDPELDPQEGA
ncbi:MAG: antitoxin family protein [Pirellulaceae bacterium]